MRAYAFLDPTATDYVSGVRWPVPDERGPGAWLEPEADSPLRGYPADQLLWWLDQQLWEVELAGDVHKTGRSVLGARGRLLAPVDAWTPDVALELTRDCALGSVTAPPWRSRQTVGTPKPRPSWPRAIWNRSRRPPLGRGRRGLRLAPRGLHP